MRFDKDVIAFEIQALKQQMKLTLNLIEESFAAGENTYNHRKDLQVQEVQICERELILNALNGKETKTGHLMQLTTKLLK